MPSQPASPRPRPDERPASTGVAPAGRSAALDGLRGVAALVVVVFHVLILSTVFQDPQPGVRPHEPSWWFTHTPLNLLWAGSQAVFVFFVLSGFVLALPAAGGRTDWRTYYPRRLVRLFLPIWASLGLAVAWVALVPREDHRGWSSWYRAHVTAEGPLDLARDAVVVLGTGWTNSPLWSLQWEVLFSLLLPLYLLVARRLRRFWWLELSGVVLVVAVAGALDVTRALYLPMFAIGVVLALERDRIAGWARALSQSGALVRTGVAAACVLLITVEAWLLLLGPDSPLIRGLVLGLQVVGAGLALVLALHSRRLGALLGGRAVQWLGSRSFSLYLTHEPLVISAASLLPAWDVTALAVLTVPLSLLLAEGFFRLVERPAHRLSRRVEIRRPSRVRPTAP